MQTLTLRDGYRISSIIKGGWQLAGDHGHVEQSRAIEDMLAFFDAGITTFDCADIYTGVESMLGEFRRRLLDLRGMEAVQRLRIHTKYVPDITDLPQLSASNITAGIDRSLHRLQSEQLDLVQFHWWDYAVPGYLDVFGHLQALQQQGKIVRLGVTNFDAEHLAQLCDQADVISAQVQYSLLDQRAGGEFADLARHHGVHLLVYGVLAGGFLTDRWLGIDDPGFEFDNRSLVKYRLIIEEFGGWSLFQQLLATLRRIADNHGVDIDAIALKTMLDHSDVSACIVGARYADRLGATLQATSVQMHADEVASIAAVRAQAAGPVGPVFGLERDTTGRHGSIMKYNINSGDNQQLRHDNNDDA